MIEKKLVVGSFQCHCRIFVCSKTAEVVVVDPGDEPYRILKELELLEKQLNLKLKVRYLLHTHAHLDHIGATRAVKEQRQSALIALHSADQPLYEHLKMQGQRFQQTFQDPLAIDYFLEDEEVLDVGQLRFSVLHTPGHTPGSVCFWLKKQGILLTGDTLFQGAVGRTDLWGGNEEQLFQSIQQRVLTLEDSIRVYPGHGPETTIGVERSSNPYLQGYF